MSSGLSRSAILAALLRTGPLLTLLLLVAVVSAVSPDFRKPENFFNIANQWAFVGIVAVGMTWVIILGGIDLSVGSMVVLLGGMGIYAMNAVAKGGGSTGWAIAAGAGVMLLGGPLLGLVNGAVVVWGRVAPFIVTVATMAAYRSVIMYAAEGSEVRCEVSSFADLGSGSFKLPFLLSSRGKPVDLGYPTLFFLGAALIGELLLRKTVLGRRVYATGDNALAARYSGVPVSRVTLIVYALSGLACGLSAMLNSSRLNSVASSSTGQMYELDAIAAVVIGGTVMTGGKGSVLGTVVGVLLLGVISNMLTMLGIHNYIQGLVKGCIIIGAVLLQRLQQR